MEIFDCIAAVPSTIIRYGILFPLRCITLGASTVAFFTTLPIAVTLKNSDLVVCTNHTLILTWLAYLFFFS